jgi:diguanylate cyclase (GGDEF)-like protein/PAS domain S-box-containing protein
LHELQVHQVELTLQNEELRQAQLDLGTSRDNFSSLYDFAPVGYCTLDRKGIIREANQMCSELFGTEKSHLIGQRLAHFVHRADQDYFYLHHQQTMVTRDKQVCEIRMVVMDGVIRHFQMQSMVSGDRGEQIRVILIDITQQKKIEQTLRESEAKLAQRVRELNAIHEATSSLQSTLDTKKLLEIILNSVLKAIPTAKIGVIFLTPTGSKPLQISAFALSPNGKQETITFSSRSKYVSKAISTKQPLLLNEIKTHSGKNRPNQPMVLKARSALIVPLITVNQTYGAISLESPDIGAFSEAEMDLVESFAASATAALRNASLHEQLQETATTDFLTKIYNRQGFFEIGLHEYQRFLRSAHPLSLIILDIDDFKAINDTFGHPAGDQILISLGQVLASQLRKADVLARYGGDEFIVLLPETDLATALWIAERLNRAVEEVPIQIGDQWIQVTISQGVCQASKAMLDMNKLIKQADDALYAARAAGRNRIQSS